MAEILLKTANEEDYELCLGSVQLHRSGMNDDDDYRGNSFEFEDEGGYYTISSLIDRHGKNVKFNRTTISDYGKQLDFLMQVLADTLTSCFPAKTLGWTKAR